MAQLDVVRRETQQLSAMFRQIDLRESSLRETLKLQTAIVNDLSLYTLQVGLDELIILLNLTKFRSDSLSYLLYLKNVKNFLKLYDLLMSIGRFSL